MATPTLSQLTTYSDYISGVNIPFIVDNQTANTVPYSYPSILNNGDQERAANYDKLWEWTGTASTNEFVNLIDEMNDTVLPWMQVTLDSAQASETNAAQSKEVAEVAKDFVLVAGGLQIWNSVDTYSSGDKVFHNGRIYEVLVGGTNDEPTLPNANYRFLYESITTVNANTAGSPYTATHGTKYYISEDGDTTINLPTPQEDDFVEFVFEKYNLVGFITTISSSGTDIQDTDGNGGLTDVSTLTFLGDSAFFNFRLTYKNSKWRIE